jgi:hypothetical protein
MVPTSIFLLQMSSFVTALLYWMGIWKQRRLWLVIIIKEILKSKKN